MHTKHPDIQFLIPAINDARKQQIEQGVEQLAPQLKAKIHILENTDSESKIGRIVMNASDVIALAFWNSDIRSHAHASPNGHIL